MLATKVLAFGVTHLTDARYFAAWYCDFLCFPLGEGDDGATIAVENFLAIREWVEGPAMVAELATTDNENYWATQLREWGVEWVMLPSGADTLVYKAAGLNVIIYFPVAGYHSAEDVREALHDKVVDYFVVDLTAGGITLADLESESPFGTDVLTDRVLVRTDVDGGAALDMARRAGVAGYAVRGSTEEKVGYKSFDEVEGLFEGLEGE